MRSGSRVLAAGVALLACGFGGGAMAAGAPAMVIQADIVRGMQKDMMGPGCVLDSQFKHKESVVWRVRVIDAHTGKPLDDKALKSVVITLPNAKVDAHFGGHPPPKPVDTFWSAAWTVPADYPTGSLDYTITATDKKGHTAKFEPFKTPPGLLTVVADSGK